MEIKLTDTRVLFRKRLLMMIMRTFIFLMCTTLFSFTSVNSFSQEKVRIEKDQLVTVDQVFKIIKQQTVYNFLYPKQLFKGKPKVQLKKGEILITKLLEQSLSGGKLSYQVTKDNTIVIKEKTKDKPIQQRTITGKVTSEAGEPLPSVTVFIKGTTKGKTSNFDGEYSITVPSSESILVFSYLGYQTQEVLVGIQNTINITLKESTNTLDEIVINAGYYNTSEKLKTGSISKITSKTIEKQPVNNPLAAMQGQMSGVNITQDSGLPGGGFNIEIRGRNSIASGTEPLFIIDGVPYGSESLGASNVSGSLNIIRGGNISPLNALNPADIESIEVLKDADATAIYGSRGANGVVLITTRKGKVGKTEVKVNLSSSTGQVTRMLDLMNTEQYLEMRLEAYANDGRTISASDYSVNGIWDQDQSTDWQKELIGGTAYRNNAQLSLSGGSDQTQFLISGAYLNETTVFPGDANYDKFSLNSNTNHQSKDNRFKLNFSANYITEDNQLPASDFTSIANTLQPNAPALYDDTGNLNWENDTFTNPLAELETEVRVQTYNLIANSSLSYQLLPSLELKTNLGYNDLRLESYITFPHTRNPPRFGLDSQSSAIKTNSSTRRSWIIEPQLTWQKRWGVAKLNILMGTTFQQQTSQQLVQQGIGFSSNILLFDLSAATTTSVLTNVASEYNYQAVFGRINFNWKDKYLFNLTGRRDGSSRFGPRRQFGNFGAIGLHGSFLKKDF